MARINLLVVVCAILFCHAALPCVISQTRYTRENPQEQFSQSAFVIHATVKAIAPTADGEFEEVELAVHEVLKGMSENAGHSKVWNDLGTDCSQRFEIGKEYLIFAFRVGDRFPDRFRLVGMTGPDIPVLLDALRR